MFIEISYQVSEDMPVYPGSPMESFTPINRISQGDPCNTTVFTHYIHGGSHVDAPYHFDKKGKTIDQIPIENFVFSSPLLAECALSKGGLVDMELVRSLSPDTKPDLLLFHTGYDKVRCNVEEYCDDFPALSVEAALYIRNEMPTVKGVAIDTLSIESAIKGPENNFPVHKALLSAEVSAARPLLVFEDLNIQLLSGQRLNRIYAFPLRLRGLDGSPVSVVAEVLS